MSVSSPPPAASELPADSGEPSMVPASAGPDDDLAGDTRAVALRVGGVGVRVMFAAATGTDAIENEIGPVRRVRVANDGEHPVVLAGIDLTIAVRDGVATRDAGQGAAARGFPSSTLELPAVQLEPGRTWVIERQVGEWLLSDHAREALAVLPGRAAATLTVSATVGAESGAASAPMTLLARDDFAPDGDAAL
ncbi:MAG: hypothetical protein ACTH31_12680, partial [Pseudoclavibacter sp.]